MTKKPQIKAYIQPELKEKFEYIAQKECRTTSKAVEYIIQQYVENYESQNGTINIKINNIGNIKTDNGNINL